MIEVKINGVAKWQVNEYTFNDPQMGLRSISLTVTHPSDNATVPSFVGAYVEYEGERYDIVNSKPTAEKGIDSINYKYNLIFNGQEAELQRRKIRNLATVGVDTFISQGTSFSLYADINQFKQLLENNLKYYFGSKWTINLGSTTSESVMVSVNNMSIWDLLLKTFEYYGLRWTITGNTINIGYTPDVIQHVFDYGYSGGLVKITRTAQSEPTINRLIGVGGSRNVPINYFTNRYSDFPVDPNPISGDVNIKNIMPKVFRDSVIAGTLPYIDYVEDAALVAADGVKEDALEPNEEIYPSIAGVEVAGLGRIDQIIAASVPTANTPDDAGYSPTFDIWVKDIGFDLADNQYTATQDAKISFTSGMLAGYEFVILATNGVRNVVVDTSKSYGGVSSKYKITLINSSEDFTATGRMLPNSVIKAMAGDSFVIYDIIMPQTYVELAELRVQNWLNEQLLVKKVEKPTYAIEPTDTFFEENIAPESDGKTIREKLKSGNKLTVNNTKVTDGAQELHINNITIQYGGLLPKYSFMVTDKVSVQGSAIARLTNEIQKTDNSVQDTDKKIVKLQQYSDRQWKEIQETITLLGAAIDGFSTGINPITVQTMQLLVGNESLQFRFVSSKTTPVAVSHAFNWDDVLKSFTTTSGIIQHMTLGITEISSNHPVSAYKFWDIASYSNNTLVAEKPYYLYAKCSRTTSGAVFLLSDVPIGMYDDANYYYFLTGILNSENSDGGRSFVSLYGFTEILPGRITTDKIVSSDGLTYFDLLNGVIGGKIRFVSGGSQTDLSDWASDTESSINSKSANFDAQPTKYRKNDTWTLSADTTVNGTAYKAGEILTATQDSETFVQAHWLKRIRYTDDTAVNNLQVNNRNYIRSSRLDNLTGWSTVNGTRSIVTDPKFGNVVQWARTSGSPADYQKEFTLVEKSSFEGAPITLFVIAKKVSASGFFCFGWNGNATFIETTSSNTNQIDLGGGWFVFWRSSTGPVSLTNSTYFGINTISGTWQFYAVGLNMANKYAGWQLSNEDVQANIDAAKQEALTAAGNAQNTANSLKDFTDTAFRDGIIDRSESAAIEKYKNSLNETMAKAEASFAKVFANTYLEGADKTALENAKINLWGQRDTLLSAINTAIADGKTTVAEKNAVDSAFNTFNNLMSAFQSALEEANKAIQKKLDDISKGYVDNLEIGSRNLLLNTNRKVENSNYLLGSFNLGAYKPIQGETVTITFKGTLGAGKTYFGIFNSSDSVNLTYLYPYDTRADGLFSKTFRWNIGGSSNDSIQIFAAPISSNSVSSVEDVMLVVGNKIAYYSKALEDTQAEINSAKLTAEQAQLQADGYMRARYVRDWIKGSTANFGNHWSEIKIANKTGNNLALGKTPTANGTWNASFPASNATDNNISTYAGINNATSEAANYVQIDLGQVYYDIDYIQVWHFWSDGRTYYNTKTEISEDGINWTTIFDSAIEGTYKETAEGKIHSQRWAKVMANLNRSKAVTDKFGTLVNGGLISPVTVELRETDTMEVTAGHTGIQGALKNLPAYWAGGTYAEALALVDFLLKMSSGTTPDTGEYAGLAKIALMHNGAAKVGDFIVEQTGRIVMVDPATGKPRLVFSVQNLTPLADLMYNADASGSVTNVARQTQTSLILTNTMNVSRDNSKITIPASAVSVYHASNNDEGIAQSYATISLLHNGNFYAVLGSFDTVMPIGYTEDTVYFSTNALTLDGCPAGTYSIKITITSSAEVYSKLLTIGESSMSWSFTKSSVRYFQFGVNGMMAFFSENHWYFSEQEGFNLRGKTNMPGVLASGTVNVNGGLMNEWGAKINYGQAITGGYRIYLKDMTHNKYSVQVTPHTNTTFRVSTKTSTYFEILGTGAADFAVFGSNY